MRKRNSGLLLLAFSAIAVVVCIDVFILNISIIAEGRPVFRPEYLLRSALLFVSSLLLVSYILRWQSREGASSRGTESWRDGPARADFPRDENIETKTISLNGFQKLAILSVLTLSLFFLVIFLFDPILFFVLSSEGRSVENLSVILYFGNCFTFLFLFFRFRRYSIKKTAWYKILFLSFAAFFFLMGMEEVSWFQRVMDIDTPRLFSRNRQNEINLHNFATNQIENLYYFCSFTFLIVIPFINDKISIFKKDNPLLVFMPGRWIIFVSAISVAYNYDMWNISFTQISFFITLIILFHYIWLNKRINYGISFIILMVAATCIITQTLFIYAGYSFIKISSVTEYKELFIPLSLIFYSLDILQKKI